MNTNKLDEMFGVVDVTDYEVEPETSLPIKRDLETTEQSLTDNDRYIDSELKDVIEMTSRGADEVLELASISESPRAYEVFSTLLKTKIDAIQQLANIERERRKTQPTSINNTQVNIGDNIPKGTNINEILKALAEREKEA